ncbi:unnamed protein product [Miscanthus lutarioriparius]|uniref:Reverse transcriptase zinc-binding domain-containing protein n=1 Tax=Miscanthus lutarioriparius TaxID=422564 RepID=A0A811NSA5_9POAL|nr:unnamed protein product [Miscanthus lutarioriparius]
MATQLVNRHLLRHNTRHNQASPYQDRLFTGCYYQPSYRGLPTGSGREPSRAACMTTAAIAEFLDLWEATADVNLRSIPFRGHSLIWKTWAPLKVKIILWLSFRKRHWTNDRRARHGLEAREECYLSDLAPETTDHILCFCPYAREVWFHICQALGRPLPPMAQSVLGWWKRLRGGLAGKSEEGCRFAIRANLLAYMEREECTVFPGGHDHGAGPSAYHQGRGRSVGSSGRQGFEEFSVGGVGGGSLLPTEFFNVLFRF